MKKLAALLLPCAALAQVQVNLWAPATTVIIGDKVQVQAIVRTGAAGDVVNNAAISFRSANANLLSVDANGFVTALRPGQANIIAQYQNTTTQIEILAAPKRVEVSPATRQMLVGDRFQYSAVAYDIDDQPIPNVPFTWQVTGANGGQINAASITNTGMLSALGLAKVTVRALVTPAQRVDRYPIQFVGLATAAIATKPDYSIRRLVATDEVRHSFTLRKHSPMVANAAGQVAFSGSLDGLAACLLLFEGGQPQCLLASGEPRALGRGVMSLTFGATSINSRGDVLVAVNSIGLVLSTREGRRYPILDGAYLGDINLSGGFVIQRQSLNANGEIVFRSNLQRAGINRTFTALGRLTNGEYDPVWISDQPLPGLTGTINIEDWAIDQEGTVYFQAAVGANRGLYRARRFQPPERLIGTGTAHAGSTVRNLGTLQLSDNGDYAFWMDLANGTPLIARVSGGALQTVQSTGGTFGPLAMNSTGGVLFRGGGPRGYGLYRWVGDTVTPVALQGLLAPNGEPFSSFDAAALLPGGDVLAQVSTAAHQFVVVRLGAAPQLIVQTGSEIQVTAPLFVRTDSVHRGSRPGPPRLMMGNYSSYFDVDPGGILPALIEYDRLPDGRLFEGLSPSFETPSGDLLFPWVGGLYRLTTQLEVVTPNGWLDAGQAVSFETRRPAANAAGWIAASASSAGQRRLYLRTESGWNVIARSGVTTLPSGGVIADWPEFVLDNAGRLMARLTVTNGPAGLFLYSGGSWQPVAVVGVTEIAGAPVLAAATLELRTDGEKFYAHFTRRPPAVPLLAEFSGGRWNPLVTVGDPLPHGSVLGSFGIYDVNSVGEVAYWANGGGNALIVRSPDGREKVVYHASRPATGEAVLTTPNILDIRDDGSIYFVALDQNDVLGVYAAEPVR